MNECARLRLLALIPLFLAILLGGCQRDAGPPPLEGATMGGPFTLTDQNGRRVSETDFAGKYRIVYFGFTFCPDVCPTDLATIGAALRQFESRDAARAARVQPIFISVDPTRDTPLVLRAYVANFHPRMIGLTGSEDEISRVARAYGVYFQRGRTDPAHPERGYPVDHSRLAVLYGPDGKPIAILPHDRGPGGVADELDKWVR